MVPNKLPEISQSTPSVSQSTDKSPYVHDSNEVKDISERKLNIEKMMEELDAMNKRKQELIERNNRLKE